MKSRIRFFPIGVFFFISALYLGSIYSEWFGAFLSENFYSVNEMFGNSILFNLFMLFACFKIRLCVYNYVACAGLLALNLVNLSFVFLPIDYAVYQSLSIQTIIYPIGAMTLILFLKKI